MDNIKSELKIFRLERSAYLRDLIYNYLSESKKDVMSRCFEITKFLIKKIVKAESKLKKLELEEDFKIEDWYSKEGKDG
jgi:hypothetical protein